MVLIINFYSTVYQHSAGFEYARLLERILMKLRLFGKFFHSILFSTFVTVEEMAHVAIVWVIWMQFVP